MVSAPADGCFAARNSMRYAVDYAAMNDHRLWHKGIRLGRFTVRTATALLFATYYAACASSTACRCMECNARETGLFGPLALAASDPLPAELRQFRRTCFQAALNGVKTDWRHWLGKGPGLTPSHDDTLSGMLLAAQ